MQKLVLASDQGAGFTVFPSQTLESNLHYAGSVDCDITIICHSSKVRTVKVSNHLKHYSMYVTMYSLNLWSH